MAAGVVVAAAVWRWWRRLSAAQQEKDAWGELSLLLPTSGATKEEVEQRHTALCLRQQETIVCTLEPATLRSILGYDPSNPSSTTYGLFHPIKVRTHCSFARTANIWTCHDDFDISTLPTTITTSSSSSSRSSSREPPEPCQASLRAMALFASTNHRVDGFLFKLPPSTTVEQHARRVNRLLRWLS